MDVAKLMKNIKNLNDYVEITHDLAERTKSSKIQLNMSIVLALKKIRSFEVEYFSKYEQNGLACLLLERMLILPPSKTWGVLGQELVALLQYWLDAVRKHLVKRSVRWWTFVKLLLRLIKEIRIKDASLPNLLVEHTAECLLDLATIDKPNPSQKYEVLHCLNMYCSESSREIRFALRSKFSQYFTKLANYMANCGHLPTQYSILETLLRWLLPRQDRTLRVMSAAKWFPTKLYDEHTANIFLERPWLNFFQDARDFLNSHNTRSELIISVVCRRLAVGQLAIITGTEHQQSWLDVNVSTKCLSVLLDPKLLEVFGVSSHKAFETLVVTQDNTETAKLHRESLGLTVSVHTTRPPRALPSRISVGDDGSCDVTVVLTSRCDLKRLDTAMRSIFDDKYQLLMNIDEELQLSPIPQPSGETSRANNDGEEARFSHPVGVKRRKHSGYIVKQHTTRCMSPSTASTSSLLQLHEKLAALPKYKFDKEPVSVCAHPELSIVSEVSETDDRQSLNSTLKIRSKPYGVSYKSLFNNVDKKPQSDPENSKVLKDKRILVNGSEKNSQSDPETSKFYRKRVLSPIVNEQGPSCLLVATIGSADDSVINETVEKLSKKKDYDPENIVDLLVQEALEASYKEREGIDSGINTGEKKVEEILENSEAIENTPNTEVTLKKTKEIKSKVISSTSDESNTEAINDTPFCFVSTRKKKKENLDSVKKTFDVQVVEQFFSQHFTENGGGEAIISPTLAKKINETSSETSDNFGDEYNNLLDADLHEDIEPADFNNIEVIQCLNNMVDKVCDEFEKCTQYLENNDKTSEPVENLPLQYILNTIEEMESTSVEAEKVKGPDKNSIKLQFKVKTPRKRRSRIPKRKNKVETPKMSTIIEDDNPIKEIVEAVQIQTATIIETIKDNLINVNEKDEGLNDMPEAIPEKMIETKTPVVSRKKRKLYSPKDEEIETVNETTIELKDNTEAQVKTPKPTATSYKDIERDRQKINRAPRYKRNKKTEVPSPRTKKMNDIFDKVKESANSGSVLIADKTFEVDVYNFSSDSEEEFKQKKIAPIRKNSSATVISAISTTTKRGRKVKVTKYSDYMSSDDGKAKPKVTRRTRSKKKVVELEEIHLVDERMREAKEDLNASIIIEKTNNVIEEPQLVLETAPVMEIIEDKIETKRTRQSNRKAKKPKVNPEPKRLKQALEIEPCCEDDRTVSPLPGLVVETVMNTKDDHDLSANMLDKFKTIYQEGPEKYINESNTTQNMLSDIEKVNYSPRNNITDELELLEVPIVTNYKEQKSSNKNNAKTKLTKTKVTKIKKESLSNVSNKKGNDVINLCETFEAKSEKSIATVGITGHGEFDEAPPTPNLIGETLSPRNLEIQDMDNSMKEYFNKLTNQLNTSRSASENKSKSGSEQSASPVIRISRLSPNDIHRWLPSRRNSDTDNSSDESKKINSPKVVNPNDGSPKSIPQRKLNKNEVTKPPHSSNVSEHDYFNNLKQINSDSDKNDSDSENEATKRRSLRIRNKTKKAAKSKDNGSIKTSAHYNSDSNDSDNSNSKRKQQNTKNKITESQNKFKSFITPIKLFDDLISNAEKSQSTLSEDEEFMKDIIDCLKKNKNCKDRHGKELRSGKVLKHREELKDTLISPKSVLTQENVEVNAKRKAEEEIIAVKRQKTEESVIDIISGATVSSVDEWFKRNEPATSRAESLNMSLKDSLRHIMEKLDTTLVEINQNTSKKFVHLFVDTQQHLSQLKEDRCALYKRVATDILAQVVNIMDEKFADLDKRSQEHDNEFMKRLKEGAAALIRQDCEKKRLMVRLLKEDIEAVSNHLRSD